MPLRDACRRSASLRNVVRKPSVFNTNVAVFENVEFAGNIAAPFTAQFRAEIYNLFDHVNF